MVEWKVGKLYQVIQPQTAATRNRVNPIAGWLTEEGTIVLYLGVQDDNSEMHELLLPHGAIRRFTATSPLHCFPEKYLEAIKT